MIRTLAATHPIRLIEQDHAELGLAAAAMSGALAARGEVLVVMMSFTDSIVRSKLQDRQ
jgi:hypothetical protein